HVAAALGDVANGEDAHARDGGGTEDAVGVVGDGVEDAMGHARVVFSWSVQYLTAHHSIPWVAQSSIFASPDCARRARPSFIAWVSSCGGPRQSAPSPTIRSGCRDRNDLVGFPRNFRSGRFGSSPMGPVGSTM